MKTTKLLIATCLTVATLVSTACLAAQLDRTVLPIQLPKRPLYTS